MPGGIRNAGSKNNSDSPVFVPLDLRGVPGSKCNQEATRDVRADEKVGMAAPRPHGADESRPDNAEYHLLSLAKFAGQRRAPRAPEELVGLARSTVEIFEGYSPETADRRSRERVKGACEKLGDCLFGLLKLVAHDAELRKNEQWNYLMTTIAHTGAKTLEILEGLEPHTMPPEKLRAIQRTRGKLNGWVTHNLKSICGNLAEVQKLPAILEEMKRSGR